MMRRVRDRPVIAFLVLMGGVFSPLMTLEAGPSEADSAFLRELEVSRKGSKDDEGSEGLRSYLEIYIDRINDPYFWVYRYDDLCVGTWGASLYAQELAVHWESMHAMAERCGMRELELWAYQTGVIISLDSAFTHYLFHGVLRCTDSDGRSAEGRSPEFLFNHPPSRAGIEKARAALKKADEYRRLLDEARHALVCISQGQGATLSAEDSAEFFYQLDASRKRAGQLQAGLEYVVLLMTGPYQYATPYDLRYLQDNYTIPNM
ncbi:MAG: hypothetical protein V1784_12270, partial [bacterium]